MSELIGRRQVLLVGALGAVAYALPCLTIASSIYPLKATRGGRLLIAAQVNGHDVEALLDSAAETSLVDLAFARRIGLVAADSAIAKGSGARNLDVSIAKGVTLSAAGLTLRDQAIAISDLSDVGRRLLGHPLEMIFGRELFDAARLRIDIVGRELEVLDDRVPPSGTRLALETVNGIEVFPVLVEGERALAALDIGNGSNVLVGGRYAERRRFLDDGRPVSLETGGGLGGETQRTSFELRTLELAGRTLENVAASIDSGDSATELNVGISVLRHFMVTTDFRAHALWLEPRR
jgi:predicted aspartyl protease